MWTGYILNLWILFELFLPYCWCPDLIHPFPTDFYIVNEFIDTPPSWFKRRDYPSKTCSIRHILNVTYPAYDLYYSEVVVGWCLSYLFCIHLVYINQNVWFPIWNIWHSVRPVLVLLFVKTGMKLWPILGCILFLVVSYKYRNKLWMYCRNTCLCRSVFNG